MQSQLPYGNLIINQKNTAPQIKLFYDVAVKSREREKLECEVDNLLIFIGNCLDSIDVSESQKFKDFAEFCGVAAENLTRYRKYADSTKEGGRHDPHLRTFYKILRGILNRPPISLGGIEEPLTVPLVEGRIAANPNGLIPGDAIESQVCLPRDILSGRRDLVAVRLATDADSMEPSLHPGDLVIIDRADKVISPHGIYAVRLPDLESCAIKRVQPVPHQPLVLLLSDNPKYPPQPVEFHDYLLIGRVVWSMTNWSKLNKLNNA